MQTVLITGANGFVGHYLTAKLLRAAYRIIATGKGAERLSVAAPNYLYEALDITDAAAVQALFAQHRPHVVVHCAAMTKPDECELHQEAAWTVNVTGTGNVLAGAKDAGAFFVHVSTDFVFSGSDGPYTEESKPSPVNYYGHTKLQAEERVQQYGGAWAIVRPILIYGHPQAGRSNILTVVAGALRENKPVRLFTDQQRRPTYVEDLVWGLHQIIKQEATGFFHFSGKDTLSPFDIGVRVARHLKQDTGLVQPVTADAFHQPARRPPQTVFDLSKVERLFGYRPTPFEEGLRKTFGA